MYADSAADFTLALALTLLFGLVTFLAWRSRGLSALLTGAGITLLPLALWLTHTLHLVSSIVDDIGDWATGLVFSPRVWVGLVVAGVAVLLIVAGRAVRRRAAPAAADPPAAQARPGAIGPGRGPRGPKAGSDPEMDEIEALLRKRGIS